MKAKRDETLRVSCCDSTYTGLCNQTWMTLVIRTIIVIIIVIVIIIISSSSIQNCHSFNPGIGNEI